MRVSMHGASLCPTIWPSVNLIAAAMGDVVESQASVAPIFVVTGFSSFSGVAANPTEALIRYLESSQPKSAGALETGSQAWSVRVTCLEAVSASAWLMHDANASYMAAQAMSTSRRAWCWTSMRASCRSGSASCARGFQQETADRSSGCATGSLAALLDYRHDAAT